MLRSILNASIIAQSLSRLKKSNFVRCRCLAPSNLLNFRAFRSPSSNPCSMAEVLRILGTVHHLFPSSDVNLYVGLLRKCIKSRNFLLGSFLHAHLIKLGFESDLLASNVLLDLYAKLGLLDCGVKLFDEMPDRDLISWCTLISGFVAHGLELEAYRVFRSMLRSGVKPNHFVVSAMLKGCSASGVLGVGLVVHGFVIKGGFGFDRFVDIGLVSMYGKCGALDDALKLFREIPVKCSSSWNAMISGYVQNDFLIQAVELCREMSEVGFVFDLITLRVISRAAADLEMPEFCRNIHVYCIKVGLDKDTFIVAELVRLFCKIGEVANLEKVFTRVKKPDASLYCLLISGYWFYGYREEAVGLAEELLSRNLNSNEGALIGVLNVCLWKDEGSQVHGHIMKTGHLSYLSIGNALISMYIRCGQMADAETIFLKMPTHDVVSWTAIMGGLVKNSRFGEALDCFHACWRAGTELDQYSIGTTINACTGLQAINPGRQIHALALKLGLKCSNSVFASLLHLYAKCGCIDCAAWLFSSTSFPHDLILINILLAGYCWNSLPKNALNLFIREYRSGLIPDHFSFSTVIRACADLKSVEVGEQLHCCVVKRSFEFSDIVVGNSIMNLYMKCGRMACACKFFYSTKRWNVEIYAMLMSAYLQERGRCQDLHIFREMQQNLLSRNTIAFTRILKGCATQSGMDQQKEIHASDLKRGLVSEAYIYSTENIHDKCAESNGATEIIPQESIKYHHDSMVWGSSQGRDKGETFEMYELFKLQEKSHEYYIHMMDIKTSVTLRKEAPELPCVIPHGSWLDISVANSVVRKCAESF